MICADKFFWKRAASASLIAGRVFRRSDVQKLSHHPVEIPQAKFSILAAWNSLTAFYRFSLSLLDSLILSKFLREHLFLFILAVGKF